MRRRLGMVLLGLGVVAGYGSALAGAHCHPWQDRRQAMLDRWAQSCVHAAQGEKQPSPSAPPHAP